MKLLLDSCSFIWLCCSPEKLSVNATKSIDDINNQLYLSDASVLEISIKHSIGKLTLPEAPENWIAEQTQAWQIKFVEMTRQDIYESAKLPWLHKDPFDRLIIATTKNHAFSVISPDYIFAEYSVNVVW